MRKPWSLEAEPHPAAEPQLRSDISVCSFVLHLSPQITLVALHPLSCIGHGVSFDCGTSNLSERTNRCRHRGLRLKREPTGAVGRKRNADQDFVDGDDGHGAPSSALHRFTDYVATELSFDFWRFSLGRRSIPRHSEPHVSAVSWRTC